MNFFHDNLRNAPKFILDKLAEIDKMPPRAGKRKQKGEIIDEFNKHKTWETPLFRKWGMATKTAEDSHAGIWVTWEKYCQEEGKESAELQWKQGSCVTRQHKRIDKSKVEDGTDERLLLQFRLDVDTETDKNNVTRGSELVENYKADEKFAKSFENFIDSIEAAASGEKPTTRRTGNSGNKGEPTQDYNNYKIVSKLAKLCGGRGDI